MKSSIELNLSEFRIFLFCLSKSEKLRKVFIIFFYVIYYEFVYSLFLVVKSDRYFNLFFFEYHKIFGSEYECM